MRFMEVVKEDVQVEDAGDRVRRKQMICSGDPQKELLHSICFFYP